MLKLYNSDFISRNESVYSTFSELNWTFNTNIPNKVLELYSNFLNDQGLELWCEVWMLVDILYRIVDEDYISQEEFDLLKEKLFNIWFYKFYKQQIYYKENVSWILVDGSFNKNPSEIQKVLDNIKGISKKIYKKAELNILEQSLNKTKDWWITQVEEKRYKQVKAEYWNHNITLEKDWKIEWFTKWKVIEEKNYHNNAERYYLYKGNKMMYRDVISVSEFWELMYRISSNWHYLLHTKSWYEKYLNTPTAIEDPYGQDFRAPITHELLECWRNYKWIAIIKNEEGKIVEVILIKIDWGVRRIRKQWAYHGVTNRFRKRRNKPKKTDPLIRKITHDEWSKQILIHKHRERIVRVEDLKTEEEKKRFKEIIYSSKEEEEWFTYHDEWSIDEVIEF